MNVEKIREATNKLTAAIEAQEAATDLMAKVKEEVKELELNPAALIWAIKRAKNRKNKAEKIDLEDDLYELVWNEDLV